MDLNNVGPIPVFSPSSRSQNQGRVKNDPGRKGRSHHCFLHNEEDCEWLHAVLSTAFPVDNLGTLTWYTGCSLFRTEQGSEYGENRVHTAFIDKIFFPFQHAIYVAFPARWEKNEESGGDRPFREVVGCLM